MLPRTGGIRLPFGPFVKSAQSHFTLSGFCIGDRDHPTVKYFDPLSYMKHRESPPFHDLCIE
jgi:hypothetical protein